MALIKCKECGEKISDKSDACIHCGYVTKSSNVKTNKKVTNKKTTSKNVKKSNSLLGKIVIPLVAILVMIIVVSYSQGGASGAEAEIYADIKSLDYSYGYGTTYTIGQIGNHYCDSQNDDGNGRFLIKCKITYYPKRNNGSIATDSKMIEEVYAIYFEETSSTFKRAYSSESEVEKLKSSSCWGKPKSSGFQCN